MATLLPLVEEDERNAKRGGGSSAPGSRQMTPDSAFPSEQDADGEQEWFDPMSHLSIEEVVEQLENQRLDNAKRRMQTAMFEEYLEKQKEKEREIGNDLDEKPESAQGNKRINRRISKRDSNMDGGEGEGGNNAQLSTSTSSRRRSKRSQAQLRSTKKVATPLTLTSVQRSQVASDRLQFVSKTSNAALETWGKQKGDAQAQHDESREQLKEIDDAWYKFEKSVLHVRSHVGNKFSAERIVFVSGERCKAETAMVDHLRLKSQVTKGQITSTTEELKSQDKMEESVSQVDFDQLQIKNREYVHYLSEGNALLLVEKTRVMHSMRQHNHTMDHLNDASNISDSLDDSVATTERMMARLAKEQGVVDNEVAAGKRLYSANKAHLEQYRVPSVVKYVEDVQTKHRSEVQMKTWVRRVQIADAQMQTHKKAWLLVTDQMHASGPRYQSAEGH